MKRQKERGLRGGISNAVAAGLVGLVAACGGGGGGVEEVAPRSPVGPLRTDLAYAYYANDRNGQQLAETKGHITHHFVGPWFGQEIVQQETTRACAAGVKVVHALFSPYTDPALETNLRAMFTRYRQAGILQCVGMIYPQDEPEKYGLTDDHIVDGNKMVRKVMAEFSELANVPLVVIYSADRKYPGLDTFDIAGIDDYDAGAGIFTSGQYATFAALRGGKATALVVGGADRWRQDPAAFIERAQNDHQVKMVFVFTWVDNADPASGAGKGVRSNGLAPVYCAWGMRIKTGSALGC